ncbi:MAG TPA: pyridoxal phosphate-dependent aminotransferase [Xanthomonadales bacterium]|nr:pyridoxal phosphate-dependent aminotransferase [Xanthomonadales bacterium]
MSRVSRRVDSIKPSATITVSAKAMDLKAAGKDIVSLGFGEPDFDTPDHIKQAAKAAIDNGQTKYTQVDGTPELKAAIISKLKRDNDLEFEPSQVLVSNGAKQSLYNLLIAMLNDGDEVIVPAPYWVSYPDMVKLAGADPVVIHATAQNDYKVSPRELAGALNRNTSMLILNSPSNPTGKVYSAEEYRQLGDVLEEYPNVLVACDDIYEHIYWGDGPFRTFLNACPEMTDRTIVINGVSKAYAMTGWRIGYAAGPEDLIRAMKKVQGQTTSCAGSVSQAAATAALNGSQDCVGQMRDEYQARYQYICEALNEIPGVHCPDADGAFYAFPTFEKVIEANPNLSNDVDLANWLLEQAGVSTVPGSAFGAPGHLRLSFAASLEYLEDAISRIRKAIETA